MKWSILVVYFRAVSLWLLALVIFLYVLASVFSELSSFLLAGWSNKEANINLNVSSKMQVLYQRYFHLLHFLCSPLLHREFYLGSYTALGALQAVFTFLATFSLFAGIRASRTLHNTMLERVLRAPMQFFDTTPLGRILNRFSKDMYIVDVEIPNTFDQFLAMLTLVLSTIVAILIAIPIFGIVIVPLGIFYFLVQVQCEVGVV